MASVGILIFSEWFKVFHHKRKHTHWGEGGLSSHPNFTMEWIKNNRKNTRRIESNTLNFLIEL